MHYQDSIISISPFHFAGISIRTSNKDNQSVKDLGNLWQRFYQENIVLVISNAVSQDIYALYTDYETDYTGFYTALIGMRVNSLNNLPAQLTGRSFNGGKFRHYVAKGAMPEAVINTWMEIWSDKNLARQYDFDFEVYGGEEQEVDIYVSVK